MYEIHFDPIDEVIECGQDETILDAAFRQGYNLVHGCREGQCSGCKAFLLKGEVSLKRYSSFALSDVEEEQGYTLLCSAMPDSDVDVELLHFDPDDYKLRNPIQSAVARVSLVSKLTRNIYRLALDGVEPELSFVPGQYVDLIIPGTGDKRSFSIANLPGGELEFIIKHYPGGRFSGLLADGGLGIGDRVELLGPYGAFHLRESSRPIVMIAGGSGMAPMLSLLRQLRKEPSARPVRVFYGAREKQDLFDMEPIVDLVGDIDDCAFVPALSDHSGDGWDGAVGLVHEVAAAGLEAEGITEPDLYLCGPPPMVDAAIELFSDRYGVPDDRIYYDKFTTAADVAR
ncbi:MAG: 2Fe-2S iron-sulfur cluster binding domain-containing protein [Pseudonocardia sp.]|nr:2Fe-2S iron-sulfur cluster binding domain-containing protein [Pseudonocardia sp.]